MPVNCTFRSGYDESLARCVSPQFVKDTPYGMVELRQLMLWSESCSVSREQVQMQVFIGAALGTEPWSPELNSPWEVDEPTGVPGKE